MPQITGTKQRSFQKHIVTSDVNQVNSEVIFLHPLSLKCALNPVCWDWSLRLRCVLKKGYLWS